MQRVCFVLNVRPDRIEEYRQRHSEVWPEMRQALADAGWHNYSLFLRDDGLLVGYVETADFAAALAAMAATEVNARWQAEMAPLFEAMGSAGAGAGPRGMAGSGAGPRGMAGPRRMVAPDEAMRPLDEIFHLE
jgi:L-rhamnose mutarotase